MLKLKSAIATDYNKLTISVESDSEYMYEIPELKISNICKKPTSTVEIDSSKLDKYNSITINLANTTNDESISQKWNFTGVLAYTIAKDYEGDKLPIEFLPFEKDNLYNILPDKEEMITPSSVEYFVYKNGNLLLPNLYKFKENDKIKITTRYNCFGTFSNKLDINGENASFIKSIDAPLPLCFQQFVTLKNCKSLESIPEDLFVNNKAATDFRAAFRNCIKLSSIPAKLFTYTPDVITVEKCFRNCPSIKSIPKDLFKMNKKLQNTKDVFDPDIK